MWILPSAWEDLHDCDHAVQLRLNTELRKRFFDVQHIATNVMPSLYRVRLGTHYRATVHKEHDQYFIMRIIPKKDDQRYYVSSVPPSHSELEQADRLPEPPADAEVVATVATTEHPAGIVNGTTTAEATMGVQDQPAEGNNNAGHANGEQIPGPIREVMQKLQTVFMYFADEQVELFKTISDVSDASQQKDKAHRDDGAALREQVLTQAGEVRRLNDQLRELTSSSQALADTCQQLQSATQHHDARLTKITEHFDAALEIAAAQIQALEGKLADLLVTLESERSQRLEMTITGAGQQVQLESLAKTVAILQDWKGAYPELHEQLTQMQELRSSEHEELQATMAGLREQLQRGAEAQAAQRTQFETRSAEAVAMQSQLQEQLAALQSRLEQAEKRGFWSWLTGR